MTPIDKYLAELRAALGLRFLLRGRLLAEAEAHLREAAEKTNEREAVARFGDPALIADELARAAAPSALVRASLLLLGALALFVLPLYGIPENTLPPAPWDERPGYLTWKLHASLGTFALAVTAAVLALATAWRGWIRVSLAALLTAAAALGACAVLGAVLTVQWAQAVPGSGTTLALVLPAFVVLLTVSILAVAAGALYAMPALKRVSVRR